MTRAILMAAAAALLVGVSRSGATPPGVAGHPLDAIQAENAQPGSTAWQVRSGGAEVYASEITAGPGDDIQLHVSTPSRYRLVVYRMGWYGGDGARLVGCLPGCSTDEQGQVQPVPGKAEPTRANWPVTDILHIDPAWVSGYYLVEALATDGPYAGRAGTTFFVLHPAAGSDPTDILVQVPVNTWEAYNEWGGNSLYDFDAPRAYAVSFDRPFGFMAQTPMWWEMQLVRFLEREGYDVSYQSDVDTDRNGSSLVEHQLVIVAGHDEYWSGAIRDAFDAALAGGTNLAFMGSNDGYWQVRYADDGRTIVSAKSLYDSEPVLTEKTAMFREIGRSECELMGVQHTWFGILGHALDYQVTAAGAADPWLAGTGLKAGDTLVGVVAREHDQINPYPETCFKPGLVDLFHYDGAGVDQNGDAVRYTAPSGARVFASGAQQFTWALDDYRSDGSLFPHPPVEPWQGVPVDPRVQQFMRAALDDLTRPAPPAGLSARLTDGELQVTLARPVDTHATGLIAAVREGGGRWHRLCHGLVNCAGREPPGTGPITVGAVTLDRWHRSSTAAFALVQR
jgi:N,N-dimethylformamidase beta subunit-like, C-terminal